MCVDKSMEDERMKWKCAQYMHVKSTVEVWRVYKYRNSWIKFKLLGKLPSYPGPKTLMLIVESGEFPLSVVRFPSLPG